MKLHIDDEMLIEMLLKRVDEMLPRTRTRGILYCRQKDNCVSLRKRLQGLKDLCEEMLADNESEVTI